MLSYYLFFNNCTCREYNYHLCSNAELTFYLAQVASGDAQDKLYVAYRLSNNTDWIVIDSFTNNITFGEVHINSELDIDDVAHRVSDVIVSDIIVKGGAYA